MRTIFLLSCFAALIFFIAPAGAVDAEYAGSEKCRDCHEDLVKGFSLNVHSRAQYYGMGDSLCEACHGPAGGHVAAGDTGAIINPAKIEAGEAAEGCLKCHGKSKRLALYKGSAHDAPEVGCTSCHMVHVPMAANGLLKADEKGVCLSCHTDVRSSLFMRSKHPLRDSSSPSTEGKMTCSSCHNPHGSGIEKMVDARSINDKCYECHAEMKAPVLWEHAPVKESCLNCHNAHGSSNDKMLVTMTARLCVQCHLQGRHQSGTLASNSTYIFNRGCLNCHPMVHGSNNPSGPILQR